MPLTMYYFLAMIAVNVLMSWALYLPYRVAHLHFLPVANMAISAYVAAYMVSVQGIPFGLALLTGFALGFLLGYVVSHFVGNAPTFAVVIVGFAFIYLTRTVIENTKAVGATLGMYGLPYVAATPAAHRWVLLALLYGLVVIVGFLIHRFDHSRLGRAASATFTDRDLAASLGVDMKRLGMLLQCFSSTLAGGCGVLYAFVYTSLHPAFFTFRLVGVFMTAIFVGGYTTQWGTLLAAPILLAIDIAFPPAVAQWRVVIYGMALILVLVLKPQGFVTRRLVLNLETALAGLRGRRPISQGGKR